MEENEQENPHIPRMELAVSPDDMTVRVILRGRYDPSINYDSIIELLNDYHVTFGVDIAAIKRLVKEYQEDQRGDHAHQVAAAQGTPSQPGEDGRIEYYIQEAPPVTFDESGRADFRNIGKYHTVEPNEVLARKFPAQAGVPGIDVYGREVHPPEPREPALNAGANVHYDAASGEYRSRIHGIYVKGPDRIDVSPVLEIPRNVGLESGNVNYEGHVKIGGNIERGSVVSALGDVNVYGTIESGSISAGGTLFASKGINTRKDGMIKVEGDLKATYVENSTLTVEGDIIVERSIIQSSITAYGDILLSARGSTITGGEITTLGSISAGVIGNKNEITTRLTLGLHFSNAHYYKLSIKELEDAERDFAKKAEAVERIKVYVQRMRGNIPADKKAEFRIIFKKYQEADELRKRVAAQLKEYVSGRYNKEPVTLTARETLHPGTEIHYRGNVEKIRAPMTAVVLRFIPGHDKPDIEAYKPPERKR